MLNLDYCSDQLKKMDGQVFQYPTHDSFACGDHQVHVWRTNLEASPSQVEAFEQILSLDERERAGRFYQASDRQQFIVARGSLRTLLARYLNLPPHKICFSYGAHGKPALKEALTPGLCFNLSHSGNLALLAVARNCEVGIDLEAIRTDLQVEAIAKQYFTRQEHAEICAAAGDQRYRLFYQYWTLKEAYLKALGLGFAALGDDPVRLSGANQALWECRDECKSQDHIRWWSHQLVLPNYAAALVTQGRDQEIHCWQLPEDF